MMKWWVALGVAIFVVDYFVISKRQERDYWICGECNQRNEESAAECDLCDTLRPKVVRFPGREA